MRVLYYGNPHARTVLAEVLPERVVLVPADGRGVSVTRTADCALCIGSLPEELDAEDVPTVVITGDSTTKRAARLAGARVLSRDALDDPEVLFAQLRAAGRSAEVPRTDREVDGDEQPSWRLERLLEATHALMAADEDSTICRAAVSAANDVLGLDHSGICLVTDDDRLEPVAYTDTVEVSLGTVPTLGSDSLAWEVFTSGDDRVYERLDQEDGLHNPETHLRSEMIFSLGPYGAFLAGSEETDAFDDADVYFAKLLATTAESALDRAAKRSELERKNAQLEEFVGVVSHDLRNPLTVATGSLALALETGKTEPLEEVQASHDRMNEIIDGLLVLAREGNAVGRTRPVIVGTVAEEAWSTVETNGATLRIGDDGAIDADRSRLRQLFENAFRNSVEHSSTNNRNATHSGDKRGSRASACQPESHDDSGDSVEHSSTDNRDPSDPDTGSETADVGVIVSVEVTADGFRIDDNGSGITPEKREALLAAEFGEGDKGFGIPIIRTIAEGHGWELALDESDSGGLRIEITTDPDGTD